MGITRSRVPCARKTRGFPTRGRGSAFPGDSATTSWNRSPLIKPNQSQAGTCRESTDGHTTRIHTATGEGPPQGEIHEVDVPRIEAPGDARGGGRHDGQPRRLPHVAKDPQATRCTAAARTVQRQQESPRAAVGRRRHVEERSASRCASEVVDTRSACARGLLRLRSEPRRWLVSLRDRLLPSAAAPECSGDEDNCRSQPDGAARQQGDPSCNRLLPSRSRARVSHHDYPEARRLLLCLSRKASPLWEGDPASLRLRSLHILTTVTFDLARMSTSDMRFSMRTRPLPRDSSTDRGRFHSPALVTTTMTWSSSRVPRIVTSVPNSACSIAFAAAS